MDLIAVGGITFNSTYSVGSLFSRKGGSVTSDMIIIYVPIIMKHTIDRDIFAGKIVHL